MQSARACALCALALALSGQPRIGPDEVSLRAAPYSPMFAGGTIRTQVELVEVPVVVRDSKGTAVAGLQREDFELFDSGKKQEISAFSVETFPAAGVASNRPAAPAPASAVATAKPEGAKRFVALVLDDLNTDFANLRRAKTAAGKFVSESLAPGDRVAVFTTALSGSVTFTADARKLRETIEAVQPHPRYSDDRKTCPAIRAFEAYLISNDYDKATLDAKIAELQACTKMARPAAEQAVRMMARGIWEDSRHNTENTLYAIASVVETMSRMPGQRMVLLTSAGFTSGEEESRLQAIIGKALHSGVIINSADLKGLYAIVPGGEASDPRSRGMGEIAMQCRTEEAKDDALAVLASGTGGQFFFNNNNLAEGFRRLGSMPEVLYVLGFAAGDVVHDGKYHALKVRLAGGYHGTVQARMGYTAPPKEMPSDMARLGDRDRILMGSEAPADVAVRITAEPGADTGPKVAIKALLDVKQLNFQKTEDRRTQKLVVIAALLDPSGGFVTGRQAEAQLALKDSSYEALAQAGLAVALSLHAAAGRYTLRVVVQEALTGKMTAENRKVELR